MLPPSDCISSAAKPDSPCGETPAAFLALEAALEAAWEVEDMRPVASMVLVLHWQPRMRTPEPSR